MKKIVKKIFLTLGYSVSNIKKSGLNKSDAFAMQNFLIGESDSKLIIFDVGAYIGVVSKHYNHLFPESEIYSFEPFNQSFLKLKKNVSSFKNIIVINKALGDYIGSTKFNSNLSAQTNSTLCLI